MDADGLLAIALPVALLGANTACTWLLPDQRGAWAGSPWWAMVGVFLIADDMTQYWWHRVSHTPLLWPLHRAHHSAKYMSIRITYRNNFCYYTLMPGLWMAGVLLYLGLGKVYAAYFVVKMAVIPGAHCAWRWDEPLYRIKALRPLMWAVERTISTPATHWAHHAVTNADGIGHYNGNFGNLLFFWDVLFGSAHITRRYPAAVGLQDDALFGDEHWADQMFYPLSHSSREHSALRPGRRPYEDPPSAAPAVAANQPGRDRRRAGVRLEGAPLRGEEVCDPLAGIGGHGTDTRAGALARGRGRGARQCGLLFAACSRAAEQRQAARLRARHHRGRRPGAAFAEVRLPRLRVGCGLRDIACDLAPRQLLRCHRVDDV